LAHEAADTIGLALHAGRVIGREVPFVGDATPFGVQRHALEIALARGRHAVPPVLGHDGDPVARKVDGRRAARRLLRRAGARLRADDVLHAECGEKRGADVESPLHPPPFALRSE
jgi:hypothetical protein